MKAVAWAAAAGRHLVQTKSHRFVFHAAGLWLLHQCWGVVMDLLPDKPAAVVGSLFRKEGRRAADFFFPYGNMSNSQDIKRYIINTLLWVVVIFVKFLFDFFVVSPW